MEKLDSRADNKSSTAAERILKKGGYFICSQKFEKLGEQVQEKDGQNRLEGTKQELFLSLNQQSILKTHKKTEWTLDWQ